MGALEALSTTPLEVDQFLYRFERAALYEFLSSAPARSATRSALRDLKMVPALELDREKLAADLFRAALRGAPEPGSKTIAVIESEGLPRFAACRLDVGQTLASLRMWPAPEGTGPRGPTIDLLVLVSDEEWCPQPAMHKKARQILSLLVRCRSALLARDAWASAHLFAELQMVWHSAAERFAKAATLARSASIAGTASAKKKKAKTRTARGLIVRTYKLVKRRNPAWKEEAIYEQTALECRGKARPTEPDYPSASTVGRIIKEWKRTQS